MNYAKQAYDKVNDLEGYVNSLAKNMAQTSDNHIIYNPPNETVAVGNKTFSFNIGVKSDTVLLLDFFVNISNFTGTAYVEIAVNGVTHLINRQDISTYCSSVRSVVSANFFATRQNEVTVTVYNANKSFNISNTILLVSGKNLLAKTPSLVSAVVNSKNGATVLLSATNNTVNFHNETFTYSMTIKSFDTTVNQLVGGDIDGINYAFVNLGGNVQSVHMQNATTKKLASSVTDFAVSCNTMFAVVRNRLYFLPLKTDKKQNLISTTVLNKDKVTSVVATPINTNTVLLGIVASNKTHFYYFDVENKSFSYKNQFTSGDVTSILQDGNKTYLTTNTDGFSKQVVFVNFEFEKQTLLDRYDKIYQYKNNKAVVSVDNTLSTIAL